MLRFSTQNRNLVVFFFIFLFSLNSFADNVDYSINTKRTLEAGINTNDIKQPTSGATLDPTYIIRLLFEEPYKKDGKDNRLERIKSALDSGADPNEIRYVTSPPSHEEVELMLSNKGDGRKSLTPNKLLDLVLHKSLLDDNYFELIKLALDHNADIDTVVHGWLPPFKLSKLFLDNKDNGKKPWDPNKLLCNALSNGYNNDVFDSIVLALEYKADPNKIKSFATLPSLDISDLLLTNNLDPSKFLNLIFDTEASGNRIALINLAFKHKADPNKIENFRSLPSREEGELLIDKGGLELQRFIYLIEHRTIESIESYGGLPRACPIRA